MKPVLLISVVLTALLPTTALAIEPDHPCYMRTADGRVINLTPALCSANPVPISSIPLTATVPTQNQRYVWVGSTKGSDYYLDMQSVTRTSMTMTEEVGDRVIDAFTLKINCQSVKIIWDRQGDDQTTPEKGTIGHNALALACQKLGYSRFWDYKPPQAQR
ncbi:hypothetical protein ACN4EK_10445 [Pantanalinema rosaneae CENA516]|uniref:hypothetical protein n=1 Tax=Pantanalinema rosaneae TaxID=1620701 RepID=UPI003D6E3380